MFLGNDTEMISRRQKILLRVRNSKSSPAITQSQSGIQSCSSVQGYDPPLAAWDYSVPTHPSLVHANSCNGERSMAC